MTTRDDGPTPEPSIPRPEPPVGASAGPAVPARPEPLSDPARELGDAGAESVLPGGHRGGFQRLPTGPTAITTQSAPADPDGEQSAPLVQWAMPEPARPARGLAAWALGFSIVALAVSLFVGWGFLLGIAAIVAAILALRRPLESRAVALWALVLGAVSLLYSAGWLLFAAVAAGFVG
ncbi:hypothetical protein [Microbacterium sp. BK668]|uniref:hypothetical protein n=1 Tax=Microbacterium sp. BK668 TaxID=2512118 RepID=UPI00105F7377|nr:hypothetical protein [Microbacterium sp. BK668]TDN90521.1 hypothetical protein EV279_0008 [Microbacterium sp. BK668]